MWRAAVAREQDIVQLLACVPALHPILPYGQKIETAEKRGVVPAGVALSGGLDYVFWGGAIADRLEDE
jgi:hypothetical protein